MCYTHCQLIVKANFRNAEMETNMNINTDVVIVGTGASGLFCALNLPSSRQITLITKSDLESSDSFLAQGGICMLKNEEDYES